MAIRRTLSTSIAVSDCDKAAPTASSCGCTDSDIRIVPEKVESTLEIDCLHFAGKMLI